MTIGTVFTLFVVPSIYVLVAKTHKAEEQEAQSESGAHGLAEAAG